MDKKKYGAIILTIALTLGVITPLVSSALSTSIDEQTNTQVSYSNSTAVEAQIVLELGQSKQLSVYSDLSENRDMIWTVTGSAIEIATGGAIGVATGSAITVDDMGVVTGINIGSAKVLVQDKYSDFSQTINVRVIAKEDEYQLAMDMYVGETSRVALTGLDESTTISWNVATGSSIVAVSSNGRVKALNPGMGDVKALDQNGTVVGQIYIRVRD